MAARAPGAAPSGRALTWIAAAACAALLAPAPAVGGPLARALDHLAARQDPIAGGFGPDGGTDARETSWAALAVASATEDPAAWRAGGASLGEALAGPAAGPGVTEAARLVVALAAVGRDPRVAGGRNPVRRVLAAQRPDGSIGDDASTTAWGLMALSAAGFGPGSRSFVDARAALEDAQRPDGGWSTLEDVGASAPITTADAVQALVAAGRPATWPALRRARAFLLAAQNADGGFPTVVGGQSTALTSAWVTLAIRALGDRSSRPPWGDRSGGPLALLARLQGPDGGVRNSVASEETSIRATTQSALAFAGRPLPFVTGTRSAPPARAPRVTTREPLGGGRVTGELRARYEDDPGGTGVDAGTVRLRVEGRDVTALATVTAGGIVLPASVVPGGTARVRLALADRAGNAAVIRWRVVRADR